jgi:hypothetical protein
MIVLLAGVRLDPVPLLFNAATTGSPAAVIPVPSGSPVLPFVMGSVKFSTGILQLNAAPDVNQCGD